MKRTRMLLATLGVAITAGWLHGPWTLGSSVAWAETMVIFIPAGE